MNKDTASTATQIEYWSAVGEAVRQSEHEWKNVCFELGEDGLATVFFHHLVRTGKPRIGDASAFLKARNDVTSKVPEAGDVLGKDVNIVGTRNR